MLKKILIGAGLFLLVTVLAAIGAASYMAVKALRPELLQPDLKQEFSVLGLTVGKSNREELLARYGPPARQREETAALVFEYPGKGALFRFDRASGQLIWYEFTSPEFRTGKGITVGATQVEIETAYGRPTRVTPLRSGTRIRYHFGIAYALEFMLDTSGRLTRVTFFKV